MACRVFFESKHATPSEDLDRSVSSFEETKQQQQLDLGQVGIHPNAYFDASRLYHAAARRKIMMGQKLLR